MSQPFRRCTSKISEKSRNDNWDRNGYLPNALTVEPNVSVVLMRNVRIQPRNKGDMLEESYIAVQSV